MEGERGLGSDIGVQKKNLVGQQNECKYEASGVRVGYPLESIRDLAGETLKSQSG